MLLASIANNMNTDQTAYRCIVTLWLFLTVPWAGLQCMTVVFPDHTHLLFKVFAWTQIREQYDQASKCLL